MPRAAPTNPIYTPPDYGVNEGELCKRDGCCGRIIIEQEPCHCAAMRMPPCSACEQAWFECSDCGWRSDE